MWLFVINKVTTEPIYLTSVLLCSRSRCVCSMVSLITCQLSEETLVQRRVQGRKSWDRGSLPMNACIGL